MTKSAQEWLMEYASKLSASQLFQEFSVVAAKLDNDTIQRLYQYEMAKDGFFPPLTPVNPCSDYAPDTLNPVERTLRPRGIEVDGLKYYQERNGDFLSIDPSTNDYYIRTIGKDHFEG